MRQPPCRDGELVGAQRPQYAQLLERVQLGVPRLRQQLRLGVAAVVDVLPPGWRGAGSSCKQSLTAAYHVRLIMF